MSELGLQLQNILPLDVASGDPVLFNEILVDSDTNITYNPINGTIAFAGEGQYYVSWFVAIQTASDVSGANFSIVTNETTPRYYTAGNGFKYGNIVGSALLEVTAGFEFSLRNESAGDVRLSNTVQVNAGMSILNVEETGPHVTTEGFSATMSSLTVSGGQQLTTTWSVAPPYFNSGNFNTVTGNYTVPATGVYSIQATINYVTTAAITISLGGSVNPSFVVRRSAPTVTNLIAGLFPILNINVSVLLTLRTILGNGTVTLAGEVRLNQGDVVGLYYVDSGLAVNLNLGGSGSGIVWSINRIA